MLKLHKYINKNNSLRSMYCFRDLNIRNYQLESIQYQSKHFHHRSEMGLQCFHTSTLIINTLYGCKTTLVYLVKMEYGWNLWLKVLFFICTYIAKKFIEIPPCTLKVLFINKFAISCKSPHFYEVKWIRMRMEEFQKYFFWTTFHHHF